MRIIVRWTSSVGDSHEDLTVLSVKERAPKENDFIWLYHTGAPTRHRVKNVVPRLTEEDTVVAYVGEHEPRKPRTRSHIEFNAPDPNA